MLSSRGEWMNIPIYVKVDKYKELLAILHKIEEKLANASTMIDDINKLKADEDRQISAWNENLADIQARLQRINDSFYHK